MIAFLGFILGQILAIVLQVARWVDDSQGWVDYFRHRRHQGRHVADGVISTVVFFAWGTGLLAAFSDQFPEVVAKWIARLPQTPEGPLVACVIGFALCFATRYIGQKWFDKPEPPHSDEAPKGD